jgi:hypothetical protein
MAVETLEGQTKTISASKLMGRDVGGSSSGKDGGPYGGTSATGKLAGIVKGNKKAIAINADKITRLKKIADLQFKKISGDDIGSKLPTEETSILDSLDNILEALRKEQKAKDKLDADDRKRKENKKRKMKESGLEKSLKVIKKQGEKMIAPVTNMFDKLKEALLMLVAGKIVIKLFDWFQDDKNREKIDTVFRFLSDWWPAIIGGILLFAPMLFGPAGFIVMIGALVIGFLPKLISATKQLFGFGQQTEKDADAANKDLSDVEKDAGNLDGAKEADALTADQIKPIEEKNEALKKAPEPGSGQAPAKPVAMQGGGVVPGSGPNKDTIPAMLAPGEFVMSRGAVQEYGSDTLAAMNAMGGGTNRPTITNNVVYAKTGGQMPEAKGSDEKTKRPRNRRGGGSRTRTEGGGVQFFANLGKGISDFFSGTQKGMESAAGQKSSSTLSETQQKALQVLAKYESGAAGYNAVNQIGTKGGRGVEGFSGDITKAPWNPDKKPLTSMTIGEIKQRQSDDGSLSNAEWIKSGKLHAVGAYQFIGNTLPGVAERAGIPDSAKFSPAVQDLMALQLMKERGISPWVGPSDKATSAERAIVEAARSEPISYDKTSGGGAITAFGGGGSSYTPPGGSTPGPSGPSGGSTSSTSSSPNIMELIRKEVGGSSSTSTPTPKMTPSNPRPVVKPPVRRGGTSVEAVVQAQEAKQTAQQGSTSSGGGTSIPTFSATAFRSGHKIKTLGIIA